MSRWLVIFLLLLNGALFAQGGIDFIKDKSWQEALDEAARQDKLIFVDAYAVWCGPCKRMDREVFTDSEVGAFFNDNFINAKIDMEKGEGLKLRARYRVTAFPTLLFISGDGTLVEKSIGFRPAADLIRIAEGAIKKAVPVEEYEKAYNAGDRSPELIYNYVNALNKSGQSSLKVANEYLRSQSDLGTDFNLRFILMSVTEADSRIFMLLEQYRNKIITQEGEAIFKEQVLVACTATAKKAVTFSQVHLLDMAIAKMKSYYPEKAARFEVNASMDFFLKGKDEKNYLKYCQIFVRDFISEDPDALVRQARTLLQHFPEEKKSREVAEEVLEIAAKKAQKSEYFLLLADVLNSHGKSGDAMKVLEKAAQLAASEGKEQVRRVEGMVKKIQS